MKDRVFSIVNALFFIFIVLIVPALSFLKIIDSDWTNKLGIILNFFAGFLIAPELLGLDRLRKFEELIEKVARGINTFLEHPLFFLNKTLRQQNKVLINIAIPIAILLSLFNAVIFFRGAKAVYFENLGLPPYTNNSIIGAIALLVVAISGFYSSIYFLDLWIDEAEQKENIISSLETGRENSILQIWRRWWQKSPLKLWILLLRPFSAPGLVLLLLPYLVFFLFFLFVYIVLWLIKILFAYILKKLSGNDQLKSIFVWWGIILFIAGNLLQFMATF